ncbi:MAG TPA: hypothetical protein VN521_07910 [Negativicutes bacterium]|nr:hypothetical protein [Negativicutes bacterium]
MKRVLALFLALAITLSISATALAKWDDKGHHGRDRQGHHDRVDRGDQDRHGGHDIPFKWRDHHRTFDKHHMERIHDSNIERHHPGLHAYRWRGYGENRDWFWHNGHEVHDAIFFFDDNEEVVSFGYMRDGVFIFVREGGDFEERDPFFFLRWFLR